jgi:prophage regulatory protein
VFKNAPGGDNMATIILRLPTVKARTGLSRSTIYLRISEGRFPKPVSLGGRAVGWIEEEVNDWLSQQIETSRNHQTKARRVS